MADEQIGRSALRRTPGKVHPSSRAISQREERSLFEDLLTKAGFTLMTGDCLNSISVDQAIFQRDLKKLIINRGPTNRVVRDFLTEFKTYVGDNQRLKSCLFPTSPSESCCSARGNQDSLVKILLGIDIVQPDLISLLLEKAIEIAILEEGNDNPSVNCLPTLILAQLRYLDNLIDSQALAEKMLETLTLLPENNQKELIILFPDILNDSDHPLVARKLCDFLLENKELSLVIIECLSNLSIEPETVTEVKHTVLKMIQSAETEDLPTLLKFVLQDLDPLEALETINEIRFKIDMRSVAVVKITSTSTPLVPRSKLPTQNMADKGMGILIIHTLLLTCRLQKNLCEAWFKVIEKISTPSEFQGIDLLMMFALHSLDPDGPKGKKIENLFRAKIREENLTKELVKRTSTSHPDILKDYFTSILKISEILLSSLELSLTNAANMLYTCLFTSMDRFCKQEVVSSLVSAICSNSSVKSNIALDAMHDLVLQETKSMASFGTYLKFLLNRLEPMSLSQIRKVYRILNHLAFHGGKEGELIQDELHMVIIKQVSRCQINYQRTGVIGALTAAKAMARISGDSSSLNTSNGQLLLKDFQPRRSHVCMNKTLSKQANHSLELTHRAIKRYPEALGLFCDELSRALIMGELDDKVELWVDENIASSFDNDFVMDYPKLSSGASTSLNSSTKILFTLQSEDTIVLNLTPLILRDHALKHNREMLPGVKNNISAKTMAPLFRLLRLCAHFQKEDGLEHIDRLLNCGVSMPANFESKNISGLAFPEKELLCHSAFYCINWFREIINAFSGSNDNIIKSSVLKRLTNIIQVQERLKYFLSETPGYVPPVAIFDCIISLPKLSTTGGKAGKKKAVAKKSRKRKADDVVTTQTSSVKGTQISRVSGTALSTAKAEENDVTSLQVDLAAYRIFFREIDLYSFVLLEQGIDLPEQDIFADENKLEPNVLLFLLQDLCLKLEFILPIKTTHRLSAFKGRGESKEAGHSNLLMYSPLEVVRSMTAMIPTFCKILEDCSGYFQDLIEQSDGILDGTEMTSEYSVVITNCIIGLFRILTSVFSWNEFTNRNHIEVLEKTLDVLATRINSASENNSQKSFEERSCQAFDYLLKYEGSLPNLESMVALIRLLETLAVCTKQKELLFKISNEAEKVLKRSWDLGKAVLKGAKHNERITQLLRIYLTHQPDPLSCLSSLTKGPLNELIEDNSKEAQSDTFPTLNLNTFPTYYRMMISHLSDHMNNLERFNDETDVMEQLHQWSVATTVFSFLVNLIKKYSGRQNLTSCLKHSRTFLEQFLRHAMPLLDKLFRTHSNEAKLLLRELQQGTRVLQSICRHTKEVKDVVLTKFVPALKKSLETLLCRVKIMLTVNNCMKAFWIGNLKNRDIHGQEILSQAINDSSENESEAEQSAEEDKGNESDTTVPRESEESEDF